MSIEELEAELVEIDDRFDTEDERPEDDGRFHEVLRLVSRLRREAGLCIRHGCPNPPGPDEDDAVCDADVRTALKLIEEVFGEEGPT